MNSKALLATVFACDLALAAFAGVEQTVNELLPKLAAAKVEDRYSAQMELQHLAANAARPGAETERADLAKLLAAKATDAAVPQPARVWVVRQLEYISAAESIGALTTLLKDPDAELKECARRALEKNPAPAATESLRAALAQGGDTNWRIGLIQSIGEKGDTASISLIAPCLGQPETSFAAARALGKIASEKALKDLWGAFEKNTPAAADALVAAANRLTAKGEAKSATAIYTKLFAAQGNFPLRAAALIGLAKANPELAKKLIVEALFDTDLRAQSAAITAAQEVYGKDASGFLANQFPKLLNSAKVFVLRALDGSAEKTLITAANDPGEEIQLAAIERLGQVGSSACIPALFKSALVDKSTTQKAVVAALARIPDPSASTALAALAEHGEPKSRIVAISALARRNDQTAAPALLNYAGEANPEVSAAACAALAKVGTDAELEGLIRLALAGKTPGAAAALQAVASRARDKSAAAQKLITFAKTAPSQQMASLFEILALLGGSESLAVLSSSAGSSNAEVKDAATRALANWPDFPATTALLVIASDPSVTRVHNVLAAQGIARLVKSSDNVPAALRLKTAIAALHAAARDEDKKLVLSALASIPDRSAGEAIKPFLSITNYQQEAGLAAMTLAETLRKTDKPAARDLAEAVKKAAVSDVATRRADALLKRN
jgi:HEAT repeat protein